MTRTRRFGLCTVVAGALAIAGVSCGGSSAKSPGAPPDSRGAPAPTSPDSNAEAHCFNAVADGEEPAQTVFKELGREGNGETWFAILNHVVRQRTRVGEPVSIPAMDVGEQYSVEFEGRRSWFGFDVEAGTALFCSGDRVLLALLRDLYVEAREKPELLRKLVKAVPDEAWDD